MNKKIKQAAVLILLILLEGVLLYQFMKHIYYQALGSGLFIAPTQQETFLNLFFKESTVQQVNSLLDEYGYLHSFQYSLRHHRLFLYTLIIMILLTLAVLVYFHFIHRKEKKALEQKYFALLHQLQNLTYQVPLTPTGISEIDFLLQQVHDHIDYQQDVLKKEKLEMLQAHENIMHEIKNQMAVILIQLQMNEHNEQIEKNLTKINEMVNLYLEMARISAVPMEMKSVQLTEIIEECIYELQPLLNKKAIDITFDEQYSLTVTGDAFWISRAIFNLLKNACEHLNKHAKLTITMQEIESYSLLIIEDNGPGFSKNQELFQRFSSSTGTGIGLSLAKKVMEAHHGNLTAENLQMQGIRFTFTFLKYPLKNKHFHE